MFSKQTIEVNDFSLSFKNLPKDSFFDSSDVVLKAMLWKWLTDLIEQECLETGLMYDASDPQF